MALLAVAVPLAQRAWRTQECTGRGGHLVVSTEDLQPLLAPRAVDDGQQPQHEHAADVASGEPLGLGERVPQGGLARASNGRSAGTDVAAGGSLARTVRSTVPTPLRDRRGPVDGG